MAEASNLHETHRILQLMGHQNKFDMADRDNIKRFSFESAHTWTQKKTDTRKDGTDSITSTADVESIKRLCTAVANCRSALTDRHTD